MGARHPLSNRLQRKDKVLQQAVPERANIAEITKHTDNFPRFIENEQNDNLMAEISREELKEVVFSLQKDKSPRPNG
jgi:hypothetical protein